MHKLTFDHVDFHAFQPLKLNHIDQEKDSDAIFFWLMITQGFHGFSHYLESLTPNNVLKFSNPLLNNNLCMRSIFFIVMEVMNFLVTIFLDFW